MLDSRRMDALRLRLDDTGRELPLDVGIHGIGRDGASALGPVAESDAVVRFCVDRRGVWLTVAEGARGVHVNGRQVRRMAMLRVGDAVYVDGACLQLVGSRAPGVAHGSLPATAADSGDVRVLLRGVGGQYHGRSVTLERPRLVGRSSDADIRIDEPAFAERHARIEFTEGRVQLRDLGSEGSVVNGVAVHDAVLQPGDQIVFDAHHRFVVEAPGRNAPPPDPGLDDATFDESPEADARARDRPPLRLPWLLLSALLIAGLLAALLLFGSG